MMENLKPLRIHHRHLHWSVHGMHANSFHFYEHGLFDEPELSDLRGVYCASFTARK
jgi:hypothetical protein